MEKLKKITIGGREIPLYYSTYETAAIQEEIGCTAFQLRDQVFGIRQADEDDPESIVLDIVDDPEKIRKFGKLIAILGNAGLEEAGEKPDLTEKWILRKIKPGMLLIYAVAIMGVIYEGNMIEAQKEEQQGPVDEGLEAEQAKKQPGN